LETISLLIRLVFFDDTGPGDGKLTAGGAKLMEGVSEQATTSGGGQEDDEDLRLLPRESEKGMESELPLVNGENPFVIESLHVM
jgi:hypothetical protein